MKRYLSHGGGVQTITLRLMLAKGLLPYRIDGAIFSDTTLEPEAVISQIQRVEEVVQRSPHPSPLYIVSKGNLWDAATNVRTNRAGTRKYIKTSIPAHFKSDDSSLRDGRGMRQCTVDYKIEVINSQLRRLLGRRRITARHGVLCEVMLGISTDEAMLRIKPSQTPWIRLIYPLVDAGMSRADCHRMLERLGFNDIVSSGCVECPHRTDYSMLTQAERNRLVVAEQQLQAAYREIGFSKVPYLHETRIPIEQVKLTMKRRPNMAAEQYSLYVNECSGVCGV